MRSNIVIRTARRQSPTAVRVVLYGTLAQRPLSAPGGATYYATDTVQRFVYSGTAWVELD